MNKRITFVKNERGIKVVHLDGKPLNGWLQGFYNNRILIYFEQTDELLIETVNDVIYREFMVKEIDKGWSTNTQIWIEWTIPNNPN